MVKYSDLQSVDKIRRVLIFLIMKMLKKASFENDGYELRPKKILIFFSNPCFLASKLFRILPPYVLGHSGFQLQRWRMVSVKITRVNLILFLGKIK